MVASVLAEPDEKDAIMFAEPWEERVLCESVNRG